MNLRLSRKFAEREYGKDTIAQIHDWASVKCDGDPVFNHLIMTSDDPYEAAYQAYNQERVLAEVQPSELDEFKAWKAEKGRLQIQNQEPQPQQQAKAPPPRSLATAAGNGLVGRAQVPLGDGQAFNAAFNR